MNEQWHLMWRLTDGRAERGGRERGRELESVMPVNLRGAERKRGRESGGGAMTSLRRGEFCCSHRINWTLLTFTFFIVRMVFPCWSRHEFTLTLSYRNSSLIPNKLISSQFFIYLIKCFNYFFLWLIPLAGLRPSWGYIYQESTISFNPRIIRLLITLYLGLHTSLVHGLYWITILVSVFYIPLTFLCLYSRQFLEPHFIGDSKFSII